MGFQVIGFLALCVTGLFLYASAAFMAFSISVPGAFIVAFTAICGALAMVYESPKAKSASMMVLNKSDAATFCSVIAGALSTYWLSAYLGLGPVVAAGLVTLAGGILAPSFGVALTCGAFVGMASPGLLNCTGVCLGAFIAALVLVFSKDVFGGVGGKLGTVAATGTCLAAVMLSKPFVTAQMPELSVAIPVIVVTVVSSVLAFHINNGLGLGPVIASGFVSVLGGLILPVLLPYAASFLPGACACGSYIGMSSKVRLPKEPHAAIAGALAGLVFFAGIPVLGGAGGKLGTTAFVAVLAVSLFIRNTRSGS